MKKSLLLIAVSVTALVVGFQQVSAQNSKTKKVQPIPDQNWVVTDCANPAPGSNFWLTTSNNAKSVLSCRKSGDGTYQTMKGLIIPKDKNGNYVINWQTSPPFQEAAAFPVGITGNLLSVGQDSNLICYMKAPQGYQPPAGCNN
jgi:hypothetical protein